MTAFTRCRTRSRRATARNLHMLIDLSSVRELRGIAADADGVRIGATATLEELVEWIAAHAGDDPRLA